jgi:3'-phosphoadenosine 5'-phosphosulfate sulfotransferase (PAPS reductase)/FAD synthetase
MTWERADDGALHVVAFSGGKDSTALGLLLKEREPRPYNYVCTPTGDELPEMFAHWKRLGEMLGSPVRPIMHATGLNGVLEEQRCLPNNRRRFCTRILKIEPYRKWLTARAAEGPVVSYVGLRADEEGRAGGAYADIGGVTMRFPLREWGMTQADVWAALDQRGIRIPERTDCARCYHQRLGEWWRLWREFPEIYAEAEAQEAKYGGTFRNPSRDSWPARLADMRARFETGEVPPRTKLQTDLFRGVGECRVCTL